jgi:signal transduction histidine kinase
MGQQPSLPPSSAFNPGPASGVESGAGPGSTAGLRRARLAELLRHNLRARVALGIGLPLLLALSTLSVVHYWRTRDLLGDQARVTAQQFGQLVIGSLRQSMLVNDPQLTRDILAGINGRQTVERAQIVDLQGQVLVDSAPQQPGELQHVSEPGCNACHRLAPEHRPPAAVVTTDADLMRVAVPIDNEPACAGCHPGNAVHIGVLLIDVPLRILWPHAIENLQADLAISAAITLLITAGVYWLMHHLVVRRIEAFRRPLAELAGGNFGARLPASGSGDEIGNLALAFNGLADQLARQAREEQSLVEMRQRAIVEERERIAGELHDGMAQVLGYVHTKATAVRLLLGRQQTEAAGVQLGQLEEAARGLFIDVREAILGLRMTSHGDLHLAGMLRAYAQHFGQYSDLPVEVTIAPAVDALAVPADTELQLLRIVQEALTNIRKHAGATHATITVMLCDRCLNLGITDDGNGFEPDQGRPHGRPQFGLNIMRERAEAIGAEFSINSRPGHGTCVALRLPLEPA